MNKDELKIVNKAKKFLQYAYKITNEKNFELIGNYYIDLNTDQFCRAMIRLLIKENIEYYVQTKVNEHKLPFIQIVIKYRTEF